MSRYLLDTNQFAAAINDDQHFWQRLADLHANGNRVGTLTPILCEFELGLSRTARAEDNRRTLRELLKIVRVWPLEPALAPSYAAVFFELKAKGRVLSQVDILIAAFARRHKCCIVTSDRDFEALPDIRCENWIAS